MNYNEMYQDMMDDTRVVVPLSSDGKLVTCEVYFRGKGDRLNFSGKASVSHNLFAGTKMDPDMPNRIGFVFIER